MDLTDMLKEASVIDHSWYGQGMLKPGEPTFEPKEEGIKKRNNTKPELEVEWSLGGPNVDLDEPAGKVPRNIPEDALADAEPVILFARDRMNRGVMGKALIRALKAKFDGKSLKAAAKGLREQFALEGIVGCIAVDGRGYKTCRDALKAASLSPYKRAIRYVIGCQCGDPHSLPSEAGRSLGAISQSTGNSVDDFLASEAPNKVAMVSHCRSTMMPILAWQGDLDQSEMDTTLIDIQNLTGLPEGDYKKLWDERKNEKISSDLALVQAIFRKANELKEAAEEARYAGKVDNSEFRVKRADNEIDFVAPPASLLEVTEDIAKMDVEAPLFEPLDDIDPSQFVESEFEGVGDFELDEKKPQPGELSVNMTPDMEV